MNASDVLVFCLILLSLSGTQGKEHQGYLISLVRKMTGLKSKRCVSKFYCVPRKERKQAEIFLLRAQLRLVEVREK